ncbi:alpha/beta-hydrolase, partial [Aureobasidium melanogenum]
MISSTLFSLASLAGVALAATDCIGINAIAPGCASREALHTRDFFYIGGRYVAGAAGNLTYDQLYVEKLTPANGVKQSKPIVLFHGGGTSGVTWLNTPDNRKGFASHFLDYGYQVYIVDQTSVGRGSAEDLNDYVMRIGSTTEITEKGFTAPELTNAYPQSQQHTQWPGSGLKGDPIFDAFESTFVPLTSNLTVQELSMRSSGCQLLSLIGPSFLISHSIGALHALLLSNDCPSLVAGNVNLEPGNIPFQSYVGNATSSVGRTSARPWGMTNTNVTYDPAISSPSELTYELVGNDTPAKRSCYMQTGTIHKLTEIAKVKYVALTGSASPHITYEHCVIDFLQQAGVAAQWIKLADKGITGNGHFGYLEKNSPQIAGVVHEWIQANC